jgi:cytidylate kinase
MATITISRQVGSGSYEIATRVAKLLGYRQFDKRLIIKVAAEMGLSENEVVDFSEANYRAAGFLDRLLGRRSEPVAKVSTRKRDSTGAEALTVEKLDEASCIDLTRTAIRAAHKQGSLVILGRGGQAILKNRPDVFHVRIVAPLDVRIRRIQAEKKGFTAEVAREWATEQDRKTAEYLKRFFGIRWDDPMLYDLVINTAKLEPEMAAQFIANAVAQVESTPVADS